MAIQFIQYEKTPTPTLTSIYKLYDSSNNEIPISNWTISGLENAYYYTKGDDTTKKRIGGRIFYINSDIAESTSTDKFYVYDTTYELQSSLKGDTTNTSRGCTTNTIGSGKTNSTIMNTILGDASGTIGYFIKNTMNANLVGGCNDGYIGSTLELDQLKNANLVDWFSSNSIWSSVEDLLMSGYYALYWSPNYRSGGIGNYKTAGCSCFAIRSF